MPKVTATLEVVHVYSTEIAIGTKGRETLGVAVDRFIDQELVNVVEARQEGGDSRFGKLTLDLSHYLG